MEASPDQIQSVFLRQKAYSQELKETSTKERVTKLERIASAISKRKQDITAALHQDFAKPAAETHVSEITPVLSEIRHTISHLKSWMKPQKVKTPMTMRGSVSYVLPEPKGCALIISPFNYPFSLSLAPVVSAIAAGNTVTLKPSEFTPHTTSIITEILNEIFEEKEIWVCPGEIETAQNLLKKPFDHIFFTGSPAVGKKVMQAAAEHLSDITLELGGKSPVIIDDTADIEETARRIVWGKCLNAGQTCVAPDYILINQRKKRDFIDAWTKAVFDFYGEIPEKSPDLAAIINDRHFQRLEDLVHDATTKGAVLHNSGASDAKTRKMAPVLLTDVPKTARVIDEEIFGPILPVITYGALDDAIQHIQNLPKPLALYIYSKKQKQTNWIIERTSAGTTVVNHNLIQFSQPNLPFGGVNNSGIGKSHGEYGFKAFSNERAIMEYSSSVNLLKILYPPYDKTKDTILKWVSKFA